jgi:hypothetical protein
MNANEIAKYLAQKEGLKKETNIAQIKEILGHLCELVYRQPSIILELVRVGKNRCKKKK